MKIQNKQKILKHPDAGSGQIRYRRTKKKLELTSHKKQWRLEENGMTYVIGGKKKTLLTRIQYSVLISLKSEVE